MKRIRYTFTVSLVVMSMVLGLASLNHAQRRNDRDIRDAVRSLNSTIDDFEYNLRYQLESGSADNGRVASVAQDIRELRDSVRRFQDNFDRRRDNRDDVNDIAAAARRVDQFVSNTSQNRRVQDDWAGVRKQIERLGTNYGVVPSWTSVNDRQGDTGYPSISSNPSNVPAYPQQPITQSVGLSGTYDLDMARSEKTEDIIAGTNLGAEQREDLREKLVAPQQIALDIRGNQVTLATTTAPPITIIADGRDKLEQSPTGKTIRLRATLRGNVLIFSSLGGETDYTITFTSVSNGQGMNVTRRITTEYLRQTVFAESVYNKTNSVAGLGIRSGATPGTTYDPNGAYSDNDQSGTIANTGAPTTVTTRPGNYVVPNGTLISGVLENEINTKVSQNNDRFRLTVQSPNEFRGASVEGYISGVGSSGTVTGRSNVTFHFERITLRNGQTYDFAGNLQDIRTVDGKTVKIDNEGTAKGDSQTNTTAKRGGIGAGIGAIIGAIAGGAKGAAIGAILGGGAGAGSVIVQGSDNIRLLPGSTISVTSSSPVNQRYNDN
ncbi:MAG TPA: hypothetical protein VNA17_06160 [Pyrinomonadaceae bacterium]|nr:hypothetical protein [Pyrinomonadaceae bacterium]